MKSKFTTSAATADYYARIYGSAAADAAGVGGGE